jgi:2-keto-4-pentenoate hydratase
MLARRALATSARGSGSGPTGAPLVRLGEALAEAKMRGTRVAIAGAEGHARGALPADVLPTSAESAYGVQGAMVDHLLKHQHSIAGWKLGATSPAARARLGFSLPFVAPIFALDLRRVDVPLDVAPFTFLGVEAEWCFEVRCGKGGRRL